MVKMNLRSINKRYKIQKYCVRTWKRLGQSATTIAASYFKLDYKCDAAMSVLDRWADLCQTFVMVSRESTFQESKSKLCFPFSCLQMMSHGDMPYQLVVFCILTRLTHTLNGRLVTYEKSSPRTKVEMFIESTFQF